MVPSINKTADLVQEIAAASSEQATGVHQINEAIAQVNQTMQHNAAASEELSATSEEMNVQAVHLQESVNYFKLDDSDSSDFNSQQTSPKKQQRNNNKASSVSNKFAESAQSQKKSLSDSDDEKFVNFD